MIEAFDNGVQLFMTGLCTASSLVHGARFRERAWILLGLFSGIFFLGDLYWLLFLLFYDQTPPAFYISDFSWDASYLFLMVLLLYLRQEAGLFGRTNVNRMLFFAILAFTVGMSVFYMMRGDIISNLVTAFLMSGLIWHSVDGLVSMRGEPEERTCRKYMYYTTLLFCFAEYGLWTSSCFWMGDTLANVYFWFDMLLSVTFLLFVFALRKVGIR